MQRLLFALAFALATLLSHPGRLAADQGAEPAAAPSEPRPPAQLAGAPPAASSGSAAASSGSAAVAPPGEAPTVRAAPEAEANVQLLDRTVFRIRVHRGTLSPQERAQGAARVLERATQQKEVPEVRVEEKGDVAIVYVGESPLIQLGPEDAAAAGDASVSVHAAAVASTVRDALAKEHSRSRIAQTVFSFSLLVFSGLLALLLSRKLRELVDKGRAWIQENPNSLPVLQVRGIEILRPAAFRGAILVALDGLRIFAQIGLAYGWILFALSLFEATSGYSERLTGLVVAPLSELMGRVARSVPVLVLAGIATLAVIVLVRFVGLFFGSVARGETSLGWLPSDLAVPTGVLVRFGILVAALIVAAPLVTGSDEGAMTRVGFVVLASVGLASTPIAASAAVGIAIVYGRRLRVGDVADVGGRSGRVRELTLLEVRLEDEDGCVVRVPHLLSLIHPTRILGRPPLVTVDVRVAAGADIEKAREILVTAGTSIGSRVRAALVGIDEGGAHFRATMACDGRDARSRWLTAIAAALASAGIPLGRAAEGDAARRADRSAAR